MQNKKNPLSWVPTVYFAMGFPFIFISMISTVMFKDLKVDDKIIAEYTSLLLLPWSLKPFFSVVMEVLGTKRKYVICSEILSALMFGALVFSLQLPDFLTWSAVFMGVIAISGSVHDIAGDGIYMKELSTQTQSALSGWQGAFYNVAKVLGNGGLIFLAGYLVNRFGFTNLASWQFIMGLSAVIMLTIGVYHFFVLPSEGKSAQRQENASSLKEKLQELWVIFKDFFTKKHIVYYLIFIFFYRFAEGLAMKIAPLFSKGELGKGGLGLSNESYGLIYGTAGAAAFIIGSILGGNFIAKFGLKKTFFTLALCFNIPFAVYLLLAIFQPQNLWIIATGIVFEYFGYGFGFVGLILFMMQQIAPGKYPMAHYAFANSLMNLSVIVPGYISGMLSEKLGYVNFFTLVMLMVIPALLLTWFVPFTYADKKG